MKRGLKKRRLRQFLAIPIEEHIRRDEEKKASRKKAPCK